MSGKKQGENGQDKVRDIGTALADSLSFDDLVPAGYALMAKRVAARLGVKDLTPEEDFALVKTPRRGF